MRDYVPLGELEVGTELHVQGGGDAVLVSKTWRQGDFEVFDFEVAGLHNFYVRGPGGDAAGVLVHNSKGPGIPGGGGKGPGGGGPGAGPGGDVPASTPVGRKGGPMDVTPGTNSPATIDGRNYTGHALDQMQGRGLTPSVVEDTIQNGVSSPGNGGTIDYITDQAKAVTNEAGDVVTTWPRSTD